MKFDINKSLEILQKTPALLQATLGELSDDWIYNNEGENTFVPFDRLAQFENSRNKSISILLVEFALLREENPNYICSLELNEKMLDKKGIHPEFGEVTLRQLLAAWVAHDLGHIAQIARVMAKQYKNETGPWIKYLPVLTLSPPR